jgi:hypothetical protein
VGNISINLLNSFNFYLAVVEGKDPGADSIMKENLSGFCTPESELFVSRPYFFHSPKLYLSILMIENIAHSECCKNAMLKQDLAPK